MIELNKVGFNRGGTNLDSVIAKATIENDTKNAEEATIIPVQLLASESIDIPKEDPIQLVSNIDERDVFEDYEFNGNLYLRHETKFIFADNPNNPEISSPNDKQKIIRTIYDSSGQFNAILKKLNWHISCKKELLRWIRKYELGDDIAIAREGIVDESEEVLLESLRTKDVDTAKFVLKTVGKRRGWSEKESEDKPHNVYAFININTSSQGDVKNLSDADLTKLLEEQIKGGLKRK